MSRPIVLSNGSMLVGINRYGLVHDFYYPYVGLENHDTARNLRHRIGIWVNGQFSWMDDDTWDIKLEYQADTLVSQITATHQQLQVRLELSDCVDHDHNVFMRRVKVCNLADAERELRVMLHQVFRISNSLSGDTAQYLPGEEAILHYKGNRNFVVKARCDTGKPFDQFSIGLTGIEGKEGTYKDAEDGELAGNPVEHGSVDSVARLTLKIAAQSSRQFDYWITAAPNREAALYESKLVAEAGLEARLKETAAAWRKWLEPAGELAGQMPADQGHRFKQSLLLIKAHIDRHGGVIASSDTQMLNYARDAYAYCWPRDSVYALWPLVRLGYRLEIINFFEFCRLGLQAGGYLMHKYQPDAAVGSSWHPYINAGHAEPPIQEDETAAVIILMREYYRASGDGVTVKRFYELLIRPMARFLAKYIDGTSGLPHASYDLWEEQFGTFTYTVAITHAALVAASELADVIDAKQDAVGWRLAAEELRAKAQQELFNPETKHFFKAVKQSGNSEIRNETIDASSSFGAWMYGLYNPDDPIIEQAVATMRQTFNVDDTNFKGIPRYVHDNYHSPDPGSLGNPWFVTSFWLAQYYIQRGNFDQANLIIQWAERLMMPSGVLSEQTTVANDTMLSVAPLVWSQAEYASTLIDLYAAKLMTDSSCPKVRDRAWSKPRNTSNASPAQAAPRTLSLPTTV